VPFSRRSPIRVSRKANQATGFAALAQGKAANEAYVLAGYKANDGNASRLKGNERISARVQEIVGAAEERDEIASFHSITSSARASSPVVTTTTVR
jgi:hypothetical protein